MSAMNKLYTEIEEAYQRGASPALIAQYLGIPIHFVEEVCDTFGSEWDVENYDEMMEWPNS